MAKHKDVDSTVTGIVGCAGLPPTVAAIEVGHATTSRLQLNRQPTQLCFFPETTQAPKALKPHGA